MSAEPQIPLRRLADFNPAPPGKLRSMGQDEFRLLPMDAVQYFDAPGTGMRRPVREVLQGYTYVEPQDVAYAKVTPCFENGKGLVGRDLDAPVFATSELTVIRPGPNLDQGFLSYVLRSEAFRGPAIASMTGAGGLKRVDEKDMASQSIWCPPLAEQRAIADYLDHETAEIDALIADLRQMVGLSMEEWRARRDRVLSHGWPEARDLTINTATWFSDRAQHWSEGALKHLFDITLGKMLDESRHVLGGEYFPYVRAADISDASLNLANLKHMPFDIRERNKYSLCEGDILVVEGGSVGTNVVLKEDLRDVFFQKTVNRIRARQNIVPTFYAEILNSYRDNGAIDTVCNGSTIMHLTAEKLGNLVVPVPPIEEQNSIAEELGRSRRELDSLTSECHRAIELAVERRSALISAAVTGQLNVTGKSQPVVEQLEDEIREMR